MNFGELSRDYNLAIGAELVFEIKEHFHDAVRRLIEDQRVRYVSELLQHAAALAGTRRQKSHKVKSFSWQSARNQRGYKCRRAGNGHDVQSALNGRLDEERTGIGDSRHAGVGNQGNTPPATDAFHEFLRSAGLVVLVVTLRWGRDPKMVQQFLCMTGILAGDQVGLAQHS